jgi:predicted aldo/keto reductase-like oxidoreductase
MRFPRDAALCDALISSAVDAGINYFDTAHIYPGSEATLGGILKKHGLREKIFIADKLPHYRCASFGDIEKLFRESLSRLQTDYIDYYLIHNLGSVDAWSRLEALGIKEWLAEKKAAGTIGEIGFSFHGKSGDFLPLLDAYGWDFCQIQYNYMNENYQAGTAGLRAIHERGMAAIIMEPLLGGKLAQRLPQQARELFDRETPGRTPAAWGLKWLWDKPEVTVVLSGMNAMEQLTENLGLANSSPPGCLTETERAVYSTAYEAISNVYKIPCTGCGYCMPCPAGVNIPGCFSAYNMSYAVGRMSGIQLFMNATMSLGTPSTSTPDHCTGCGACVKKCPQSIEIPARLKEVKKRLEPFPIPFALKTAKRVLEKGK